MSGLIPPRANLLELAPAATPQSLPERYWCRIMVGSYRFEFLFLPATVKNVSYTFPTPLGRGSARLHGGDSSSLHWVQARRRTCGMSGTVFSLNQGAFSPGRRYFMTWPATILIVMGIEPPPLCVTHITALTCATGVRVAD